MKYKKRKVAFAVILAVIIIVSVRKCGVWGVLLPAAGAICPSFYWMLREEEYKQREEEQYAQLCRMKKRIRKMRRELRAAMEAEEHRKVDAA